MSNTVETTSGSPLSLKRLTAAFAQMLGASRDEKSLVDEHTQRDPCEVSPRSIIEAVLFVGADNGRPRTAEELAKLMRDVSPEEVRQAIADLNAVHQRDAAPYEIAESPAGYRLQLREEMLRIRDKFYGRVKESRLSAQALEVLSVVAYRQPVASSEIDKLRGGRNGPLLSQLVRRGLVRREQPAHDSPEPRYYTTDQFLKFFRVDRIDRLPRAAELDD